MTFSSAPFLSRSSRRIGRLVLAGLFVCPVLSAAGQVKPLDVDLDSPAVEHQPPSEHPTNTPLVVYAETTAEEGRQAVLHYRTGSRWRKMEMHRVGEGYAATIPCDAVRSRGTVSYYIEILDSEGNVITSAGSDLSPYAVPVEDGATATAHLPNAPPPAACAKAEESAPESDDDEPERDVSPSSAQPATSAGKPSRPRAWLSLTLSQDTQIASGDDVCSQSSQLESGYTCFRQQGSQYVGTPQTGTGGQGGGFELATTRALAGIDYAIVDKLTLGARAGYVLRGGGPKPAGGSEFLPLHAEGRLGYWFADRAYDSHGFAPFAFGAFGIGQIDSRGQVTVTEDQRAPRPTAQLDNPPSQDLDAWKKSGVGFAALGVGAYVPVGDRQGALVELRGSYLFPSPGIAFTGSVGYALGL